MPAELPQLKNLAVAALPALLLCTTTLVPALSFVQEI
jgi:hypothetical protein